MAKKEIVTYSQQTFENIKHTDENGTEFWYARELQTALELPSGAVFKNRLSVQKPPVRPAGWMLRIILPTSAK